MARRQNPKGEGARLRDHIVAAASELLLTPQPPSAPSLRSVARRCGVSPTAVYLHFASQRDLVRAVVEDLHGSLAAEFTAADDPALPVPERLARRAVAYVHWGLANPGAYQLLFESEDRLDLPHEGEGPGWQLIVHTGELLTQVAPIAADEAVRWATRVWVALHGLVSLRVHKPDQDWPDPPDTAAREIMRLHLVAVAGSAGQPGGRSARLR